MDPKQLNRLFGIYLTCSYAYYAMDVSLIPDTQYDQICKTLLRHYDSITHRYRNLVKREDLEAGTGFAIKYPKVAERAIRWYVNEKLKSGEAL